VLKNLAHWGYWTDTPLYRLGTERASSPFFEALKGKMSFNLLLVKVELTECSSVDESGWAWLIPLHNGTTFIGIIMNQDIAISRRKAAETVDISQSPRDFHLSCLSLALNLFRLLQGDKLATSVESASDDSYSSPSHALPYARTVGDWGCSITPFFSSGVHIARCVAKASIFRVDCRRMILTRLSITLDQVYTIKLA